MTSFRLFKITAILASAGLLFGIAVYLVGVFPSGSNSPISRVQAGSPLPEQDDQVELVFLEPFADLGIRKGVVEHRFHYRNRGEGSVVIERVTPSCSCTLVQPSLMELGPGEVGSFEITIDLNKQSRGVKRFLVHVKWNWPFAKIAWG